MAAAQPISSSTPTPTLVRDAETGATTIRAIRLTAPLQIDGRLDEALYRDYLPASDFIQMEPSAGQPATEKTEVWLAFDANAVYVSFRAWESDPARRIVNEMRRDSNNIRQGDSVGIHFDPFRDRRNALLFEVNSLGGRTDGQSVNERQYNGDWNPVWEVKTAEFDGGWTVEAAIPFKSLRYAPGTNETWGFQARRTNKSKNEISFLTAVPPSFGIARGSFSASLYAAAVGIDAPAQSLNLEIKPYAIANVVTDHVATPARTNDPGGNVGVDAKWAVTPSLTADLTWNTDFAQVEADEQQVNLTRFSLFFPEKREFFLENLGVFGFGGVGGTSSTNDAGDTPLLFYSRRIGLSDGHEVPIIGGGRLTGRIGAWSLGAVNIQTGRDDAGTTASTNFSTLRVKRDVLRRSSIGMMTSNRTVGQSGAGTNQVAGVDGTFAFFANLAVNTYLAKSWTTDRRDDDLSYRAQVDYAGDRYGAQLEHLAVGANFNPEVGYRRRPDMRKNYGQFRFSPRPAHLKGVRKVGGVGTWTRIENGAGLLETRSTEGEFFVELQNSDRFFAGVEDSFEFIATPFRVSGRPIGIGEYDFVSSRIGYNFGQQRPVSGNLLVETGGFYDGTRTALGFSRGRINVSSRLAVEPTLSINWVSLPAESFTTAVGGARATYTVTPLMFASTFVQVNSSTHAVSANVRFRWEYRPGSELFLVFNEERDTRVTAVPTMRNRSVVVKINRWLRF